MAVSAESGVPETRLELYRELRSDDCVMAFAFGHGVLRRELRCAKCGHQMHIIVNRRFPDKMCWKCYCGKISTIRTQSFGENSNLNMRQLIWIIFMWSNECSVAETAKELGTSEHTVSLQFNRLKEACLLAHARDKPLIGGNGHIVELDETQLTHKQRDGGRVLPGSDEWILGGIDRTTGEIFVVPVENRKRKTLKPLILKHVRPGTVIFTDSWKAYDDLETWNGGVYEHGSVNHNHNFVDPVTGVHTQRIERCWRSFKEHKKRMQGIPRDQVETYCAEYAIRHAWKCRDIKPFAGALVLVRETCWNLVQAIY